MTAGAVESGQLVAPADGPVSWTDHADLAEVAARALADDDLFDGVTPPLTAPEALDLEAVAATLTDITGRTITRVVVDDEEWRAASVSRGMPAAAADFTLGLYRAARRGEFAVTAERRRPWKGHLMAVRRTPGRHQVTGGSRRPSPRRRRSPDPHDGE
jgi:uncharacterized protein YbjT (DUF2867 family)